MDEEDGEFSKPTVYDCYRFIERAPDVADSTIREMNLDGRTIFDYCVWFCGRQDPGGWVSVEDLFDTVESRRSRWTALERPYARADLVRQVLRFREEGWIEFAWRGDTIGVIMEARRQNYINLLISSHGESHEMDTDYARYAMFYADIHAGLRLVLNDEVAPDRREITRRLDD